MNVLEGVTVLDFTQAYSGPFCAMNLADFGARVIKIERRGLGDQAREWTPFKDGHSGYFAAINRNKESISLDISKKEGADIVKRMLKDADIVLENFKCGTMDKMGLSYDELKKINPAIIYASISGFGQEGPLKSFAAYDNVIQAITGVQEMTGFPDESPHGIPTRIGPAIGDNFTGLVMALAISMAYLHKLNTGKGQYLDVAMMDTMFGILESPILFYSLLGEKLRRTGNNEAARRVPYGVFPCRDGYFSVGLVEDSDWGNFCNIIGMPELIDDMRFVNNEIRCKNYAVLNPIIEKYFKDKTRKDLEEAFTAGHIPNGPVLTIPEMMNYPQMEAREMLIEMDDPGVGKYKAIANPMKLDKTPAQILFGAPLLGQDTEKVLNSFGYSEEEIKKLYNNEII